MSNSERLLNHRHKTQRDIKSLKRTALGHVMKFSRYEAPEHTRKYCNEIKKKNNNRLWNLYIVGFLLPVPFWWKKFAIILDFV